MYAVLEEKMMDAVVELNTKTQYVRFEIYTIAGLRAAFSSDVRADLLLI